MTLSVDRGELARFVAALFCRADPDSFVSMRAFYDHKDGFALYGDWQTVRVTGNDDDIVDAAEDLAKLAAGDDEAIVFAPPIATFTNRDKADEASLANGLVISAELDSNPATGRQRLEAVLGPATLVMESGGLWLDPETGELIPKLHIHWRLKEPTRTRIEHDFLKEANRLAAMLASGDPSGVPLVHPLRWAGSVHRKAEPRLARIIEYRPEIEITLADALDKLRTAVTERVQPDPKKGNGLVDPTAYPADLLDLCAALAVILNDDSDTPAGSSWKQWNDMGLRIYAATGGSDVGLALFLDWSRRSKKFDASNTRERWKHYASSPPDRTNAGAIFNLARAVWPGFVRPSKYARQAGQYAEEAFGRHLPPEAGSVVPSVGGGDDGGDDGKGEDEGIGVSLEDFYCYMPMYKFMYAPSRELWLSHSLNARLPLVFDGFDKRGNAIYRSPSRWLAKHRPVEMMTWAPGELLIIRDRLINEGGWIERRDVSCFNLYLPPTLPHGDPTKAAPWLDHIRRIYPEDAEHIICWLAHRVQRPAEKINHAIILSGAPGIGKDTLLEPVKRAIGPWNFREASPTQVVGRFNGFLKGVILRISEIKDLGEGDRYSFYEHMKAYTAAPPDVLRCDEKNIREHSILNVCGVVYTTNYKAEGLYLPADDRRHYVAWSTAKKEDFPAQYWIDVWSFLNNGGDRHVAAYLDGRDLSTFNPKAPPPQTPAFWDIVNAHRAPEDAELMDTIENYQRHVLAQKHHKAPNGIHPDDIDRPRVITLAMLLPYAVPVDFREWLTERKNRRVVPHRFEACGYVPVRNPDAEDGLWRINGRREAVYALNGLTRRDQIVAAKELK
jgi:hypothetical protein